MKNNKKISVFMCLLIPIAFLAFYKTYFSHFPNFPDYVDYIVHIHFLFVALWIFMLILQPFLISKKKIALHRKIGKLSYFIFPALLFTIVLLIIRSVKYSGEIMSAYFPIADGILLLLFYSLAIYYKKQPEKHMKYMIGTGLVFLGPTIGRIGGIVLQWSSFLTQHMLYGMIYTMLILLLFFDYKNNRDSTPYKLIFIGYVLHQIGFYFK